MNYEVTEEGGTLHLDGEEHAVGAVVKIEDESVAAPLVACGAIKATKAKAAAAEKPVDDGKGDGKGDSKPA